MCWTIKINRISYLACIFHWLGRCINIVELGRNPYFFFLKTGFSQLYCAHHPCSKMQRIVLQDRALKIKLYHCFQKVPANFSAIWGTTQNNCLCTWTPEQFSVLCTRPQNNCILYWYQPTQQLPALFTNPHKNYLHCVPDNKTMTSIVYQTPQQLPALCTGPQNNYLCIEYQTS